MKFKWQNSITVSQCTTRYSQELYLHIIYRVETALHGCVASIYINVIYINIDGMSRTIFNGKEIVFLLSKPGYRDVLENGHPLEMRIPSIIVTGAVTKSPRHHTNADVLQVSQPERWPSESNLLRDSRET